MEQEEQDIIEKIDIGGISLIRAAAKNFKDVVIVPSKNQYAALLDVLKNKEGETSIEERKALAKAAFEVSSSYDTAIYNWFAGDEPDIFGSKHKTSRRQIALWRKPTSNRIFLWQF